MGTDLDLRPAKADLQEGDSFGNRGITPCISPGLFQFLAQLGQRLGLENRSGLFSGGFVHQRLQSVEIPANRLGGWPETGLAIIINDGIYILFWVPVQASHDVIVQALSCPIVA